MCETHCCLCELDLHECEICETPVKHGAERCERCSQPRAPFAPGDFERALQDMLYSFPPFVTPIEQIPLAFRARA